MTDAFKLKFHPGLVGPTGPQGPEMTSTAAGRALINSTVTADAFGRVSGVDRLTLTNGTKLYDYADPTSNAGNIFLGVLSGNLTNGPGGGAAFFASNNIGIGTFAFSALTTGYNNVGVGAGACEAVTSGNFLTAIGLGALQRNTSGYNDTAVGALALGQNTVGYANTAVGYAALANLTGGDGSVTACRNVAMGNQALISATTGYNNTGVGVHALNDLTTGAFNSAFGISSGYSMTTGSYGTFIGQQAGFACTGSRGVFIGNLAGSHETAGDSFYLGSIGQADLAGDKKYSMMYGTFAGSSGTISGQNLYINVQKFGIGTAGNAAVGQLSLGNSSSPSGFKTYTDTADQGVIEFYEVANFPTPLAYNRVLDIVCGSSTVKSAIRFGVSHASAGSLTFPVYIFNAGMVIGQNYVAAFNTPPAGGMLIETQLGIGVTSPTGILSLKAGTAAMAQINLASSTAPTSPNNGDIWFDGSDIKLRAGGTTYTLTKV